MMKSIKLTYLVQIISASNLLKGIIFVKISIINYSLQRSIPTIIRIVIKVSFCVSIKILFLL